MRLKKLVPLLIAIAASAFSCATPATPTAPTTDRDGTEKSTDARMRAYLDAATVALNGNDLPGALSYAREAEKLDPSNAGVQHLKALIFAARGERPTALMYARKAVSLDPTSSGASNTLGKLLVDDGKESEAEPYLLLAARDPVNREAYKAWTNLGIAYYRQGKYAKSTEAMDHAIMEAPLVACVAFYYRGHIEMAQSKLRAAIHDYDSSTRKYCADFADGKLALGLAYERDHQYDKARRTYIEVLDRFKDNTQVADQATHHLKYLP